jgi:hypothetical protein
MDINFLISFKKLEGCKNLEDKVINNILEISKNSSLKYRQRKKKTLNNILKNKNIQNKKEQVVNITNLFLNKLTNDNTDIILEEFVKRFGIISKDEYNTILKSLFIKIIYEINFISEYLNFMKLLISIYYEKFNYEPDYFFDLIEKKIEYDYLNKKDDIFFKKFNNENYRKSNLILIRKLVEEKFLDSKMLNFVKSILLNQNDIPDIYVWLKDYKLTLSEQNKIENLSKTNINFRSKVLLNNLLNLENENENENININDKIIIEYNNIKNDTKIVRNLNINQDIESQNIYEEYFLLNDIKEVGEYILEECSSANKKNNFCKIGIEIFTNGNHETKDKILKLYNILIKKKSLYKSNLSRGLMLFLKKNKNTNKNSTKLFLQYLLSKGITNGIEFMFKKYKVNS